MDVHSISTKCARTEFVGTAVLDTIGLVISGVDDTLLKEMNIGTRYHTLGLFSSRTGAADRGRTASAVRRAAVQRRAGSRSGPVGR